MKRKQKPKNNSNVKKPSQFSTLFIGKEKDFLLENLSLLVSSGMGIIPALISIKKEMKSKRMKKLIGFVVEEVQSGSPLHKALEQTGLFKQNAISLIRIGEESGRLAENIKTVALQEEKNKLFKAKIQSAMMYPVLVVSLMGIVGTGIAWFILPKLATVFSSLNLDLPLLTRWMIALGDFLQAHGLVAVPVFMVLLITLMAVVFFIPKTKFIGQWMLLRTPGIGNLVREIEMARFGYLLGTLLGAGVQITEAIDSLLRSTDFYVYGKFYKHLLSSVSDGASFKGSFESFEGIDRLIPNPVQQLIISGEQSGSLSEMLVRVGASHEVKIDQTTKNLSVVLEPLLLIIIWIGVVLIALAVIMPVYSLIGGLGGSNQIDQVNNKEVVEEEVVQEVYEPELVEESLYIGSLIIDLEENDYIRVRSIAGTDGDILGEAYGGEEYEVLDYDYVSGWYQIEFESGVGAWVSGVYVIFEEEQESVSLKESNMDQSASASNALRVTEEDKEVLHTELIKIIEIYLESGDFIYIRNIPSTEGVVLDKAYGKSLYTVVSVSEDDLWYEIEFVEGVSGWISSAYTR